MLNEVWYICWHCVKQINPLRTPMELTSSKSKLRCTVHVHVRALLLTSYRHWLLLSYWLPLVPSILCSSNVVGPDCWLMASHQLCDHLTLIISNKVVSGQASIQFWCGDVVIIIMNFDAVTYMMLSSSSSNVTSMTVSKNNLVYMLQRAKWCSSSRSV